MDPDPLDFDAVILAGGRSSRLGGVPKQGLTYDGDTLLRRSAAAAGAARSAVVVGPSTAELPEGLLSCREEPVFGGPAAAIGAGLARLAAVGGRRPPFTLVLACDMPHVELAVAELRRVLGAAGAGQPDGFVAVSEDGRRQPLVAFYSTSALQNAVNVLAAGRGLTNASVTALLASLDVQLVAVPAGSTADVDTRDDAAALGVAGVEPLGGSQRNADADDLGGKA
ncbi:molybdenum cofactor guanylyltransferase [Arthrobacter sp. HMWF013]|uniref:molybdenum cofactor guanylyltransferase n=1 Tax=Arthrobacter sp. HMWF013 TaxID=2056849 RepID=UPI002159D4C0|nr:NTP transferase domain-containing protein [Arthrobacter sp. HMWF013]